MKRHTVQRVLGLLLMVFSVTMLTPIPVAWIYGDPNTLAFEIAFATTILSGALIWFPARRAGGDLRLRDGFLVVALFWCVLGLFGALPFFYTQSIHISFTDAAFESISGLTTTGSTVLVGLDSLPHSILFYRQQLQWLGGMGIIVLAVAILPMLGVGGMQMYKAETPGPMKDSKLTPRIAQTAKGLWLIYVGLTVACMLSYRAAGMSVFDAVAHAFSTVSTGGYSPHDASMGWFDSSLIHLIAVVFMFLSGVNFALHFLVVRERRLRIWWQDAEFRLYTSIFFAVVILAVTYLFFHGDYQRFDRAVVDSLFQVASIITSTGYTTANFSLWPTFLPALLIFLSFMGGCGGSTAGGMKMMRFYLLFKQGYRELYRLIHPNSEVAIKIGGKPVENRVIEAVWGFFSAYVLVFTLIMLGMIAVGMDQVSAFSAVAATMNNLGPGLGDVAATFKDVPDIGKWLGIVAMLFGRLEVFTLLALMHPAFWRP